MATAISVLKRNIIAQVSLGVLVIMVYFGVVWLGKRQEAIPAQSSSTTDAVNQAASAGGYKNGSFTAIGTYTSPGAAEHITVSLTLENGIITASTVTPGAENPASKLYQDEFIQNYKQFVIGKNIADLQLSRVAGSSLTPKGFNEALEKIKAQAQL